MIDKYDLSVVTPVYNVDRYISETLFSVVNQETNFKYEIIIIDDGSTDETVSVIESMDLKNLTIFKQKNQGAGAARNKGIDLSKGKYIYFCDSDDILRPNLFEEVLYYMEKDSLDLYCFSADVFYDGMDKGFKPNYSRPEFQIYSPNQAMGIFIKEERYTVSPCLYISRLDNIKEHGLYFPTGYMFEDNYFTFFNIACSSKISSSNMKYYRRRVRKGSVMTGNNVQYQFKSWINIKDSSEKEELTNE